MKTPGRLKLELSPLRNELVSVPYFLTWISLFVLGSDRCLAFAPPASMCWINRRSDWSSTVLRVSSLRTEKAFWQLALANW